MIKEWATLEAQLDSILMGYTSPSKSMTMNLTQKEVAVQNSLATEMNKKASIGSSKAEVSLPDSLSFCDILKNSLKNKGKSTADVNCTSATLIQKLAVNQVAVVGANGRESNVASSQTVTVSFADSSRQPLDVSSLPAPLSVWIPRSASSAQNVEGFTTQTASSISALTCLYNDVFLQKGITTKTSGSIHVQFRPSDRTLNVGYLVLMKFGSAPKLNSTKSDFDLWQVYCSNDTTTQNDEQFFLLFANMSTVNGRTGFVGLAFRELTQNEMSKYCTSTKNANRTLLTSPPILDSHSPSANSSSSNSSNCKAIRNDLQLRIFQSGCYYMDTTTGSYKSDGTEVLKDTNIYVTHCEVRHCTEFAGGFIVLPAPINFEDVFANASITQNPIIYATVFTIIGLYVCLAVLCRLMDMRDNMKKGVTMLNEDRLENLYEVVVFTGNRKDASTESGVHLIINGENTDSHIVRLYDTHRKLFRRGGVDTFIISTQEHLGKLACVRVWHDNKGKGAGKASWFLKHIIIHDLTNQARFFFICERWLAVEHDDGKIERILVSAGDKEKTNLKYLIKKEAQEKLSDGHLWFSLLARPVQSSFTRLDRLTCVFVLMCVSMLANILYYGTDTSTNPNALVIGPFTLTPEQIGVGIMTNLIVFPPSFLLLQLFRRSRGRKDKHANEQAKKKR
jgi:hypothetical protein